MRNDEVKTREYIWAFNPPVDKDTGSAECLIDIRQRMHIVSTQQSRVIHIPFGIGTTHFIS